MACGGSSGMDTSLTDTMECSVCAELFRDPKQLLCGHTLCASCVSRLVAQAKGMTGLGGTGGHGRSATHAHTMISCPECRQPTAVPPNGLPTNYKLADLVNRFQAIGTVCSSKQKQCQICQSKVAADKLWHCASCSQYAGMETNSMCSDCGVEHHNGHQLLKISTHMVERRNAAIEHIRQCRETASQLVSNVYNTNMQIIESVNSLNDSLNDSCRTRFDLAIQEMDGRDICSDNYLEKMKESASSLCINAEEVMRRVAAAQEECVNKLQNTLGYAVSALSQSALSKTTSMNNLDAIAMSSAASSSSMLSPPFVNLMASGFSPAANAHGRLGASGSGTAKAEIIDMVNTPDDDSDEISEVPQANALSMSLDREDFTRPLAMRLQQRNRKLGQRKTAMKSRTPK